MLLHGTAYHWVIATIDQALAIAHQRYFLIAFLLYRPESVGMFGIDVGDYSYGWPDNRL